MVALGGPEAIVNNVNVVDYEQGVDPVTGRKQATAIAEDGRRWTGDLLVGADGIRSKVGWGWAAAGAQVAGVGAGGPEQGLGGVAWAGGVGIVGTRGEGCTAAALLGLLPLIMHEGRQKHCSWSDLKQPS